MRAPLLKIYNLHTLDKKSTPLLLRSTKLQSTRPHPVSTIALSNTLSHLAIGFADGSVLLYRHLDQSLASSGGLTTLPKPRAIFECITEPITGLGFRESSSFKEGEEKDLGLFIVTTNRVLLYTAMGKGSGAAPVVVDEVGTGLGLAKMDWRGRDMIVARDEAVYVVGGDGRGNCYAYEGAYPLFIMSSFLLINPCFLHRTKIFNSRPPILSRDRFSPDSALSFFRFSYYPESRRAHTNSHFIV